MRQLLESELFRTSFINRFADLLNTSFLPGRTTSVIREMKQLIEPEVEEHIARWSSPESKDEWERFIKEMLHFAEQRPHLQFNHIMEFF